MALIGQKRTFVNQQTVIHHMHSAVCAVGLVLVDDAQHCAESAAPHFEIVGTGFLITQDIVITNRHVLTTIKERMEREELGEQALRCRFLSVRPGGFSVHFKPVGAIGLNDNEDIGFLHVKNISEIPGATPVRFADPNLLQLGQPIGMLGYAGGTNMELPNARRDETIYRWGPLLHQGHVAALAPVHNGGVVTRILLDIRAGGGMSGAPVFLPETGEVVGIHFASNDAAAVRFAIPLPVQSVNANLDAWELSLRQQTSSE